MTRQAAWLAAVGAAALWAGLRPETARADDLETDFQAFLAAPTKENYLKVHKLVTAHAAYDPYSQDLGDVGALLEKGQFQEARAKLDQSMPNLLLSPRAQSYYRVALEGLGDHQEAKRRDEIAEKCLQGILATGNGTPKAPYLVTRTSDEYDVIRSFKKRMSFQALREVEGRSCDMLRCTDESEIWFDVTAPLAAFDRKIRKQK